ncbi:c-type cytochrome biogenesis protein CcsB [Catenuloplanes atrovinosus]|uniref:Cytochrome c-type biogenesis protein CcsB n=1 Tax=Catenuloplanes atrovinosus TaxID=137266 RepID=A0AAE3YW81_9ACTN|nr:c-type cytochrome biogenesis protein CcsB [Catenuloplanes atrovinosus]MDR7279751.1 cytochrome c-type biogenesis protein CcsB [Catenuloplanes atrovinosus]
MAELSDQLLVVTVLAYLVAMICHAAEYAFGTRSHIGRAALRPERELVLAGAGGPAELKTEPSVEVRERKRPAVIGWAAVGVTVLAALAHLGTLVTRGIAADRVPWGNMYEFIVSATFIGIAAWFVVLVRWPGLRHLGLFVALFQVLLLGVAGMVAYTPVGPLVPALDSAWFIVHIAAVSTSSGIFLLGVVPATLYLMRNGYEKGKRTFPYSLAKNVPAAVALERLTFRLHAFAFPIWTFGALIAGPIWAEASWGRYWGWDPKEVWAFISWIVYAGYLHARATPSVRRNVATWIAIVGFLTMLMNLFGVNLFFGGLHSYAGV